MHPSRRGGRVRRQSEAHRPDLNFQPSRDAICVTTDEDGSWRIIPVAALRQVWRMVPILRLRLPTTPESAAAPIPPVPPVESPELAEHCAENESTESTPPVESSNLAEQPIETEPTKPAQGEPRPPERDEQLSTNQPADNEPSSQANRAPDVDWIDAEIRRRTQLLEEEIAAVEAAKAKEEEERKKRVAAALARIQERKQAPQPTHRRPREIYRPSAAERAEMEKQEAARRQQEERGERSDRKNGRRSEESEESREARESKEAEDELARILADDPSPVGTGRPMTSVPPQRTMPIIPRDPCLPIDLGNNNELQEWDLEVQRAPTPT